MAAAGVYLGNPHAAHHSFFCPDIPTTEFSSALAQALTLPINPWSVRRGYTSSGIDKVEP